MPLKVIKPRQAQLESDLQHVLSTMRGVTHLPSLGEKQLGGGLIYLTSLKDYKIGASVHSPVST